MTTGRLEAFSDGVVAILITIMVLELPVPHGSGWSALDADVRAKFAAYVLSFVFLGIYWANHHHMLHMTHRVNGKILWANLHLLFWLSLVPFATAWMGPNHLAAVPTAVYGIVLFAAAIAYTILQTAIIADQGPDSKLKAAVQHDVKGKVSLLAYAVAIAAAFANAWVSDALYVLVALMWLVPDPRIESRLKS